MFFFNITVFLSENFIGNFMPHFLIFNLFSAIYMCCKSAFKQDFWR